MTDSGTIRAVLFDMDGTLADSEPTHGRASADVLTTLGLQEPPGFGEAVTGMSMQAVHRKLVDTLGLPLTYLEMAARKYTAFAARAHEISPRPGAMDAVRYVDDAGLRRAIVSNSDRILVDITLRAIGLLKPDLISVCRNDVRHGKPDPEPYLRAAWLLQVEPHECLVVEDSATGAAAALAAGMRTIGWPEAQRPDMRFPRGCTLAPAHELLSTLQALRQSSAR